MLYDCMQDNMLLILALVIDLVFSFVLTQFHNYTLNITKVRTWGMISHGLGVSVFYSFR